MKKYHGVPIFEGKVLCDRKYARDLQGEIYRALSGYNTFDVKGPHRDYLYVCESPGYGQALSIVSPLDAFKMFKSLIDKKRND